MEQLAPIGSGPAPAFFGRYARRAFTLTELLTVIAIIAILIGVSIPTLLQTSEAFVLTGASNQVVDQLTLARQEALSHNEQVEVRFYDLPAPNNGAGDVYRAMQSFAVNSTATNALTHPIFLPIQVQIASSTTLSTALDSSRSDTSAGTGAGAQFSLPGVGQNYTYMAFRFKSDGSVISSSSLAPSPNLCLTLYLANHPPAGNNLPKNWATMQIDPLTGRVQTFRP